MRAANLALKFLLELAAIAAVAFAASEVSIVLAVIAAAAVIVAWGVFAAPRSDRRLPTGPRIVFELGVFGIAVVALLAAGATAAALVLAALCVLNAALLTAFRQWEA